MTVAVQVVEHQLGRIYFFVLILHYQSNAATTLPGLAKGRVPKKKKTYFLWSFAKPGAQCIRMGVMKDNFVFDRILHFS